MRPLRTAIGLIIWSIALGVCAWWFAGRGEASPLRGEVVGQLWQFMAGGRNVAELEFEDYCPMRERDPVFVVESPQSIRQVGEVSTANTTESGIKAQAVFYASAPDIQPGSRLVYYRTEDSMEWVLRTMLPEEKRSLIMAELASAYNDHSEEILQVLRPVAVDALREALAVVEEDLPPALARRSEEFQQLGEKYQQEIVDEDLVPLVREEVWPVVRKHAEPAATEVGREIWSRVSLWRFGWRYAYDRSILPKKDLTQQEWDRFLEKEAIPILEAHTDDFVRVQQQILAEVASNPKVREAVRASVGEIIEDPEAQQVFWEVVQEVILENPRVKEVLDKHWKSPRVERALQLTAARLDPTVERIGQLLFGSPETGVTPEFARVLRNQILRKDKQWLVLEIGTSAEGTSAERPLTLRVSRGDGEPINPFVRQ